MKTIALLLLLPALVCAENTAGFIERFALAADREKALAELVPGSPDYYFYHALHFQNERDTARLNEILNQWRQRFPKEDANRRIILNREALISYSQDPQATLAYLIDRLNLRFDHQQEARDQKPDLPTRLDPARVARDAFLQDALQHDRGLGSLSQEALAALIRDRVALTPDQRRAVLQRLEWPDVPNLVTAIREDLDSNRSYSFGDLPIHRALLPAQLDELLEANPSWLGNQFFVHLRLRKMAPSADVNLEFDEVEREAWLERVWEFAQKLPPIHNTLKARILYQRLDHDRKKGVYDSARFLEYLKLPRRLAYINPRWIENIDSSSLCNLGADLSEALLHSPPVGNDESLVREYFMQLFAGEAKPDSDPQQLLAPWTDYVRDTWLKPVLAEALIVHGIGSAERWAPLIAPAAFQRLKDRVDIEFPATNAPQFLPGDAIQFDVILKNTPKLIVKIYELNALNYFQTHQRQLNTDLNLDGLVANSEQTHVFDIGPFKRARQSFKFPELAGRRGAWIIEFIGGGRSSRTLVRVGQWQVLQQTSPAGDLLLVLDEKNQPVKEAVAWFEGRKLVRDEKLDRILVPFSNQPGVKPVIVGDAAGSFATLTEFEHHAEQYHLDAQFHVEREELLSRREATLAVRTALMIGSAHLAPELLEEPKLSLTTITLDGISTTREVKDLKLSAGSVLTHRFPVPDRLSVLKVSLSGLMPHVTAGGEKHQLITECNWMLNGIDRTDAVSDGHLSTFDGQRVFELLGKNGEPIADQQVLFTFKHREFDRTQMAALRTDEKGRVHLGTIAGIREVSAEIPNGRRTTWPLEEAAATLATVIQAREGEVIQVPAQPAKGGDNDASMPKLSLLEWRAGTFSADYVDRIKTEGGFHQISGLPAGTYSLRLAGGAAIEIRVGKGDVAGGWVIGKHRKLELKGAAPLHITSVENDAQFITVRLANSSPFARVHVTASRFDPGAGLFGGLGMFSRFSPAAGTPAQLPNLYSAGREIGDEYRYILERRFAKLFPGNMLTRPGLLLNPWEIRNTDLQEVMQQAGEGAAVTAGGAAGVVAKDSGEAAKKAASIVAPEGGTNLDFLAAVSPALYNLVPDKDGVVRIDRKSLGDRQHVQIHAEDLLNASWRTLTLPEANTQFADQRLARNLNPAQSFTQKKEITVLESGKSLPLADILTSELESYDTLASIYSLFTTLNGHPHLADFAFILDWPKLNDEQKRAKYGEFACHELNFFIYRKDKPLFDSVIKPYLANKKDKTFMDKFLLGHDLARYLEPWAYARLNMVERILLAQRLENEAPQAARHARELWEMIPPNSDHLDHLFETALRGRALGEVSSLGRIREEKVKNLGDFETRGGVGLMDDRSRPAATPTPSTMAAADPFSAPVEMDARAGVAFRRSASVDELQDMQRGNREAGAGYDKNVRKELEELHNERQLALGKVIMGQELLAEGKKQNVNGLAYYGLMPSLAARELVRSFFRALGPTKEWAENNYHKLRIVEQNEQLVTVNAFWRDYADWVAAGSRGGFVSPHVAESARNFTEMMLALAVLDLPFEAAKHDLKDDNGRVTFTAGGPCIIYHKEIKPAEVERDAQGQLLVSQSFFRHGDRYRQEGNEKFEKYVTTEFLTGATYGANIVVTNPTSSPVKAAVLLQIPQGALPVLGSKATDSKQVRLQPYTTQTFEYHFYFPLTPPKAEDRFAHFPVNVVTATGSAAAAPFVFNVVAKLTEVDTASWDYLSQYGGEAEVFSHLEQNNLQGINLERVAWRCRESVDFYRKLVAFMNRHHVVSEPVFRYAVRHDDRATLAEWLKLTEPMNGFLTQCGAFLDSPLVVLDPIERRVYEHLEYSPLVNQRSHRLGGEWRIANPALRESYIRLLVILAHKPILDAADSMSVVYYHFLQDRVEEALTRFKAIDPANLPARLQHDYFQCYAAFYEGDVAAARGVASKRLAASDRSDQSDLPPRWKKLFSEVLSQAEEIEGKAANPEKATEPDRERQQSELAATEPSFEFKVENRTLFLNWRHLSEVTLNYYLMDPEFSFSSSPFVSQDASRFNIIKPNKSAVQALPADRNTLELPLPGEYAKANVLVEVIGAGQRKTQAYHANTLKLTLAENYGRIEARDSATDKPLPKTYVKVYARLHNGTVRFYKDGYTDLRGRFDYTSLNSSDATPPQPAPFEPPPANGLDYQMLKPAELNEVEKLALLILSDTHGATVKEVNPPGQ